MDRTKRWAIELRNEVTSEWVLFVTVCGPQWQAESDRRMLEICDGYIGRLRVRPLIETKGEDDVSDDQQ